MASVARPIGDLDLHLFGEGTHRRLWELLGPQPLHVDEAGNARAIRFGVWAPNAVAVGVVGDWNDWTPEPLAPARADSNTGIWTAVAPAAASGHRYKYEIRTSDGRTLRKADPMARQSERPPERRERRAALRRSTTGATTSGWPVGTPPSTARRRCACTRSIWGRGAAGSTPGTHWPTRCESTS